jgi:hypothetical protein
MNFDSNLVKSELGDNFYSPVFNCNFLAEKWIFALVIQLILVNSVLFPLFS